MNANEYQEQAARTLIDNSAVPAFTPEELQIMQTLVGAAENIGALVDAGKKSIFHQAVKPSRAWLVGQFRDVAHWMRDEGDMMLVSLSASRKAYLAAQFGPQDIRLLWNVSGLIGEAAEVATTIRQMIDADVPPSTDALSKELGDVLWYVAAIASVAGLDLRDIMAANIAKLRLRYPEGWDKAASAARVDVQEAK